MQRVIKDWSIEQMITRGFDQSEDADRQNKNNVTEKNRSQKSPSLGDPRSGSNAIYSWSGLSYLNRITGTRRSVPKLRIDHRKFGLLNARGYARQVGDDDPFKVSDEANY